MSARPVDLLARMLQTRLAPDQWQWLADHPGGEGRTLLIAFALIARKVQRTAVEPDIGEIAAAVAARPGWRLRPLTCDQAARHWLILTASGDDGAACADLVTRLSVGADAREQVALYRGLPLYPDPARYIALARTGLRSNSRAVFAAIAAHNPFPAEEFDDGAWNQMILKACFTGVELWQIQGLDARANPALAAMLRDYAHERRAAGRSVPRELWRCLAPYATPADCDEMFALLADSVDDERDALALALHACPQPETRARLRQHDEELVRRIATGNLAWPAEDQEETP
jgi:hypothetical protein